MFSGRRDHLIAERIEYGKSQKAENLTKEPHDNSTNTSSQNYVNPVNYEPINLDTGLMQYSVHTVFEFIEGKVDNYYPETHITYESEKETEIQSIDDCKTVDLQDELALWEPVEILDNPMRLTDGQIIEQFMLEEEDIEFQGIDEGKIVDLQDEQEIEECIASETVELPEIPVRIAYGHEECIKEEISDVSLPEMCSAEGKLHTDELKLQAPKINIVEISEMPGEIKLEVPLEQSESKLMQDVTLVGDVPTPFHNHAQHMTKLDLNAQQNYYSACDKMGDFSAKWNYSR